MKYSPTSPACQEVPHATMMMRGALLMRLSTVLKPAIFTMPSSTSSRPRMQFSITSGCSNISFSIKCLYSPFWISCSERESSRTSRHSATLSSVLISYPRSRWITTISPSLRYETRFVRSITADASEASMYSLSPMPRMSGEPLRAPTSISGSSAAITTIPNAPWTCVRACRTASSSGIHFCWRTSAIRWAMSSVSVSERIV
mmetsp:Transcript_17821/g.35951  ORF Transcript_17821/g.35951 Transcript_17821/m.35951 type:complete len:202 (-) Transcript_17821:531-1136(-)